MQFSVLFTRLISKFLLNSQTFSSKHLVVWKIARTFAPAFENNASHEPKRKSSLKDLHKQRSSTRSELHYLFSVVWVERNEPSICIRLKVCFMLH